MTTIDSPLVSVIMNCYNGKKYLNEALTSVINQTYQNWELIFWDNQSVDGSDKIFKNYKDIRLKYFYAPTHTTLYQARNLAMEKAIGDFITFIDADDLWKANKLELQIPHFQNPKIGMVYSNFWVLKKDINKKKLYTKKKLPSGMVYEDLIKDYKVGILTVMIKKSFYLKLEKKFNEKFSIIGDFDLFLRLSKICEFKSLKNPLAYYRLHGKNLSVINRAKEPEELKLWLDENKNNISSFQISLIQKKIDYINFLNSKIAGKYRKCLDFFLKSKINLFTLKCVIIFLTPIALLKKLLWYYQD